MIISKFMATCLGYREGTGCKKRSRSTQKRVNWEKWQLCHACARTLHPEFYKDKKNHGVNKTQDFNLHSFSLIESSILVS